MFFQTSQRHGWLNMLFFRRTKLVENFQTIFSETSYQEKNKSQNEKIHSETVLNAGRKSNKLRHRHAGNRRFCTTPITTPLVRKKKTFYFEKCDALPFAKQAFAFGEIIHSSE